MSRADKFKNRGEREEGKLRDERRLQTEKLRKEARHREFDKAGRNLEDFDYQKLFKSALESQSSQEIFDLIERMKEDEDIFESFRAYVRSNYNGGVVNSYFSKEGNSLIHYAAVFNYFEMMDFLVDEMKADCSLSTRTARDDDGITALILLFSSGNIFEEEADLRAANLLLSRMKSTGELTADIVDELVDAVQSAMAEEYSDVLVDFYEGALNDLFKEFNEGDELPPLIEQDEDQEVDDLADVFAAIAPPPGSPENSDDEKEEDGRGAIGLREGAQQIAKKSRQEGGGRTV